MIQHAIQFAAGVALFCAAVAFVMVGGVGSIVLWQEWRLKRTAARYRRAAIVADKQRAKVLPLKSRKRPTP